MTRSTTAPMITTDAWSIDSGYEDVLGGWHQTAPTTRRAIIGAMGGAVAGRGPERRPRVRVLRAGQTVPVDGPSELALEDATVLRVERSLPGDLPLGYHDLRPLDGGDTVRVIIAPPRCHVPEDLRTWGWAVQLYAARSRESWGMGDLADLRRLAHWSATALHAGVLLINPLHAATPIVPQEPSPYFPSSRRFRNPLYLRIEELPGAAEAGAPLARLADVGRALCRERRIDRDRVHAIKLEALELLWHRFGADPAFDRFRTDCPGLAEFAAFCALAEHHGVGWQAWPPEHRRPDSLAVRRFATERIQRVRFHEWLQWLLDVQLERAGAELALVQDLPIGVDPAGADAWVWQDVLATGATVGAPPDRYNLGGQDWGLPPFVPHLLAAAAYEPFVQTIRATLRHAGGLRIDHVMGLFRLFWIPHGSSPAEGAFVRYAVDDLLGIVALESHRARAFIIGEDLGTVEAGVRDRLAEERILSYRLLWFETDPPSRYPELALAAVTTHDLPTIRGLWTGSDVRSQKEVGLKPNEEALADIRKRVATMAEVQDDAAVVAVIERAHRLLAQAPSALLAATLDDALAAEERPNMPGTTVPTNWSVALPAPIEDLEGHPLARAIARALRRSP